MARTATPAPTDKTMWRKLLRVVHPDVGGDPDLFIWTRELEERVAGGLGKNPTASRRRPAPPPPSTPRIPFPERADFDALTKRALIMADELPTDFARLLFMLRDCKPFEGNEDAMYRGASYKQLALVAHKAGLSKDERSRWYT